MRFHFRALASFTLLTLTLNAPLGVAAGQKADDDYDRLDGTGTSRKKVNVIEWEGNLEIHVYPAGSLKGLALKIDESTGKKVMVIGYRFDVAPKEQLVRRAILGIELKEPFHTYRDTTAQGYDKIIITGNTLTASFLTAFKLDPQPTQLYPDGHPALAAKAKKEEPRKPAGGHVPGGYVDEDSGTIKPFTW